MTPAINKYLHPDSKKTTVCLRVCPFHNTNDTQKMPDPCALLRLDAWLPGGIEDARTTIFVRERIRERLVNGVMRELVRLVLEMTRDNESSTELDSSAPPHLGFAQTRTRARHHHRPHGHINTNHWRQMLRPKYENLTRTTTMTVPTQ